MSQLCRDLTEQDIVEAKERLKAVIKPTPLIQLQALNERTGYDLYVKMESVLPIGSFKLRGAYNKIAALTEEERRRGVVTASSGNHAQGVSLACKWLGADATVVVPEVTPARKIEACKQFGANVIVHGGVYDEAYEKARLIEKEEKKSYVHPVADTHVIAGQATIGTEIFEQLQDVQQVVVPIGGGGLISGIAIALKQLNPKIKVIGVQPEGSPAYYESIKQNKMITLADATTIADGLSVKEIEPFTLSLIKRFVDEVIVVREKTIMKAIKTMLIDGKILVEGAGAAALAAILEGQIRKTNNTVIIASGGNIDQDRLIEVLKED